MVKYPSIEQWRNVVSKVSQRTAYVGKDENGNPIYDGTRKKPTIQFVKTVKIHGCFEKDTLVTLANGEKEKISNLKPNTYILSYNIETKKQEVKKVLNVINQKLDKEWCKLTFDDTSIICTKDHKIYTKNRGYVEAQYLSYDDEFVLDS